MKPDPAALLAWTGWPEAGSGVDDQLRFRKLGWIVMPRPWTASEKARLRRARELSRRAQKKEPGARPFLLETAACYWLGAPAPAMAACRKALEREPGEPLAHFWLAALLLCQGDPEGALRAAEAGLALRRAAWGLCLEAEGLLALKRFDPALSCLREALALEPRRPWALVLLSELYRDQRRFDDALDALNRLASVWPRPWAFVLRARTLFNFRDQRRGLRDLDRALRLDPRFPEARAFRAEAYRRLGRLRESVREFDAALKLRPDAGSRVRAWRAGALFELGRYREAIADFSANIAEDRQGNVAWPLSYRAQAYLALGEFDRAVEDMNRAVLLNPKMGWIHDGEGAQSTLHRRAEIVGRFSKALERRPRWAWGWAWRGETQLRARNSTEALSDLSRAVELDPSLAWAWAWRGLAKEAAGDLPGAAKDLDRAMALDREYAPLLGWRARLHMRQGRYRAASALLSELLALDKLSAWAYAWRGECLARLGRLPAARKDLESAVNLHAGYGDAWAWLAEVLRRQGEWKAGEEAAKRALSLPGRVREAAAKDPRLARRLRRAGLAG